MKLTIENLKFDYGKNGVLKGVNLILKKGETVAVLGENGAGKSTLLKTIAKILKPLEGKVFYGGEDLHALNIKNFSKKVGYVNQKNDGSFLSVFDTLLLGRKVYFGNSPSKEDVKKVEEILERLNLKDKALVPTNELSGGELQKVVIARALLQESEILLLDEPTNNLDLKNQLEMLKTIKDYGKNRGVLSILVMHDINLSLKFCDKFIFMKNGKIEKEGDKSVVTPELIKKIYSVEVETCEYKGDTIVVFKD
jgi:iron complex transport system ATP-binding protein